MKTFTQKIRSADSSRLDTPNTDREESRHEAIQNEEDRLLGLSVSGVVLAALDYPVYHDVFMDAIETVVMEFSKGCGDADEIAEIIYGMKLVDVLNLIRERAGITKGKNFIPEHEEYRSKLFRRQRDIALKLALATTRLAARLSYEK